MGLAACPICSQDARAETAHWTYDGATGAKSWGELDPQFKACAVGSEQSPVNLAGAIKAEAARLALDWKAEPFQIVNNGHTIQANAGAASSLTLDGKAYGLKQFHFHAPSEHALNGERSAMEAHFVHAASDGALTVVGAFLKAGAANAGFAARMGAAPAGEGQAKASITIDPSVFLPASRALFRSEGSLTTPPCSEIVNWLVMETPVEASAGNLAAFVKLFPDNARPLQPLNRRFLLRS